MAATNIFSLLDKFGPLYDKQTKQQQNLNNLNCKFFGLLFTAQWCGGCVQLSKILPSLLKKVDKTGEEFKLITIRMDNSSSKFGENYLYFPRLQYEQAQDKKFAFNVSFQYEGEIGKFNWSGRYSKVQRTYFEIVGFNKLRFWSKIERQKMMFDICIDDSV